MEHILIALDATQKSLKSVSYVIRMFKGAKHIRITLFHVLPTASPDLLKETEVWRIERIHEQEPRLSGYFWTQEDEAQMAQIFADARQRLIQGGFSAEQIATRFHVQIAPVPQLILEEAHALRCGTIVLGRRGLGRIKEFLQGSVSHAVTKLARDISVWVVGD
jgi:nucleotide-binding universal stress UspA family protein